MSPKANVHFSIKIGLRFTKKNFQSGKETAFGCQSLTLPFVTGASQQGLRRWLMAKGDINFIGFWRGVGHGGGEGIRQCSQLPQLETVIPHLDFIIPLKCSSELALSAHWRDRSIPSECAPAPAAEMWPTATSISGISASQPVKCRSCWPSEQRAGNRLNTDVKGDVNCGCFELRSIHWPKEIAQVYIFVYLF